MTANLIKMFAAGAVNVVKLEGKDTYLLAITTKDTKIFVPMITTASANWAYVEDDGSEESAKKFDIVDSVLSEIKTRKAYTGFYAYRPKSVEPGRVPEHSHTAVDILKGTTGGTSTLVPKGFAKMLKDAGYTLLEKDIDGPRMERDYSALLADPQTKANFDADAAELAKVGATYEGLSLEVKMAYESVQSGRSGGIIFEGPTGTGKSWIARILANHANAPLLNVQITNGTTVDDLVGMFIPAADSEEVTLDEGETPTSDVKPTTWFATIKDFFRKFLKVESKKTNWEFVAGPLLKAYSEGYQIVVEEINYGQPGVNAVLNQFTDGTARITVNGKVYHRHPNFVVYMTMNPGYEGTDNLNVALKNRFSKVLVGALSKAEFCNRAEKYSAALGHKLSTGFFQALYDFAGVVEKEGSSSKFHENVKFSIRNAQGLCDNILLKKRSYPEFAAAVAVQYLNDLSCDNDNSDKLEAYKASSAIEEAIKDLYDRYDFAELKEVDEADSLDSFLSEDGASDPTKKTEKLSKLRDRVRL